MNTTLEPYRMDTKINLIGFFKSLLLLLLFLLGNYPLQWFPHESAFWWALCPFSTNHIANIFPPPMGDFSWFHHRSLLNQEAPTKLMFSSIKSRILVG